MKRANRRPSAVQSSGGEQGFWPSYADMMSAVALVLFFLMLLAYIQNIITNNDLMYKEEQLRDTMAQLELTSDQVAQKEAELQTVSNDLEIARSDLEAQQAQITQQQAQIDEQSASIAQQQTEIAAQQAQAEQQRIYLAETQDKLNDAYAQMQTAAFLRLDIVEQIRSSIEQVLGNANSVTISDSGSLVLSESVLFDRSSSELKADSKAVLDQLALGFAAFLADSDSTQYVDTIMIAGHADSTGGDALNRKLSTDRANSVLNYLLKTQGGILAPYASYFGAAGYGSTRPVASNDTLEGQAQNRRIEISIVLKDDSVMDALNQALAIEVPES